MNAGARMSMMVHSHTAVEFYSKVFGQPHVVTEVQSKAIGGTVVADLPCYDVVVCQGGTCPDEEFVEWSFENSEDDAIITFYLK